MIIDRIGHYKLPNRNWYRRDFTDIEAITVHHDAIPHGNRWDDTILEQIKQTHINKNWPGASYHFWIGRTGKIYQLNDLDWITWHDSKNTNSIGICVNGYFHPDVNDTPEKRQLDSLYWLIRHLLEQYGKHITVRGHRDVSSTACPGDNLYPLIRNYNEGSMPDDGNIEISKKTFEELVTKSDRYDKFVRAGYDSAEKMLNKFDELKNEAKTANDGRKQAEEAAEISRKELRDFIATLADDQHLKTRQDKAEIISVASRYGVLMGNYEDISIKYQNDKELWGKTKAELESEIARLRAMLDYEDVLSNATLEELIRAMIKKLTTILRSK